MLNPAIAPIRNWDCSIEQENQQMISLSSPLTADIDIKKTITGQLNWANIKIYNLNQKTRNAIEIDSFLMQNTYSVDPNSTSPNAFKPYRKIEFNAGYNNGKNPNIFTGNILEAYTQKLQEADIILTMTAGDGLYGLQNSIDSISVKDSITLDDAISQLQKKLKKISPGFITKFPGAELPRGFVYNGFTLEEIKTLAVGDVLSNNRANTFVDNEKLFILGYNETITNTAFPLLNITNQIGVPRKTATTIEVKIVFEPNLKLGQNIEIKSSYDSSINGTYKVMTLHHQGTLSSSKEARLYTTIQCWRGLNQSFTQVQI